MLTNVNAAQYRSQGAEEKEGEREAILAMKVWLHELKTAEAAYADVRALSERFTNSLQQRMSPSRQITGDEIVGDVVCSFLQYFLRTYQPVCLGFSWFSGFLERLAEAFPAVKAHILAVNGREDGHELCLQDILIKPWQRYPSSRFPLSERLHTLSHTF